MLANHSLFHQNIVAIYGKSGAQWLEKLPTIVRFLADLWQLSQLETVNNLSYHYILTGMKKEQPIVLKLGLNHQDLMRETMMLKVFQGYGGVKLLDHNKDQGALLIERAMPGHFLKSLFPENEEEAIQITSRLISNLHRASLPSEAQIPTINHWLAVFDKEWDLPIHYLQKARKIRQYLIETAPQSVLLHGDLHHDNILAHEKDWVVIDPKGVIGEEAFEVAAFIRNPFPDLLLMPNVQNIIHNRIHQFAKFLNVDPVRLYYWSYVHAVLSTIWALEDGINPINFIRYIEILDCAKYQDFFAKYSFMPS